VCSRSIQNGTQRVAGVDRETEELPELADDQDNRDAWDVAQQHLTGEVVGDPAEAKQPSTCESGCDHQREHRRQLRRVRAGRRREREDRRGDEGRDRSPPDLRSAAATSRTGRTRRLAAGARRHCSPATGRRPRRRPSPRATPGPPHRHTGHEAAAGARSAVPRQLRRDRERADQQRLRLRRLERRCLGACRRVGWTGETRAIVHLGRLKDASEPDAGRSPPDRPASRRLHNRSKPPRTRARSFTGAPVFGRESRLPPALASDQTRAV
jgi:hypothetical protein